MEGVATQFPVAMSLTLDKSLAEFYSSMIAMQRAPEKQANL